MARGGVFPMWFGKESTGGTPARAHLVSSILLTGVVLLNFSRGAGELFQFIASVSLAAGMLSYLMAMLAGMKLLPGERMIQAVAVVAAAFIVWAAWGLGEKALAYGALSVVAGVPVYWAVRRRTASPLSNFG
jgi:APA family basic amino acid/polyamine antiporter